MDQYRFNPPPGWPAPPPGWVPPPGWEPEPSWPPPPPGWQLWVPVASVSVPADASGGAAWGVGRPSPAGGTVPAARQGGMLRRLRRDGPSEAAQLREWIHATQGADALNLALLTQRTRDEAQELRAQAEREAEEIRREARDVVKDVKEHARRTARETELVRKDADRLRGEAFQAETRLTELRAQIVTTDETAMLQQVGIYAYRHPLQDAVAYRSALDSLRAEIKDLARKDGAVLAATDWTVNGSVREGRKMVRDFSKLMLRAYNAEADYAVRSMRPYRLTSLVDRLYKSRETIAKLGSTMHIRISDGYHNARVRELEMTADFLQKKEEEKEAQREARAREREEAAAQRELDREREKLHKEMGHYQSALERLRERGDHAAVGEMEAKLADLERALNDVEARAANVRTGYVYVISNVGAFGDRIVKIGMTRRLEPLERVYELSGAAVPFRFDVHALIFSKDAVGLETRLHQEFAARRVNRVNSRKEFFYVTPVEVRDALERCAGEHVVEFSEVPQALEWRASTAGAGTREQRP
ncbi:DUF4041 domain-containing protein [Streptomyces sp. NPDC056682]|uniref:DUF4041 domain-containing protein n=1 Tax=Streptomyces sp. NPDC056682 TaxID=3345909 RepID=UPI0036921407